MDVLLINSPISNPSPHASLNPPLGLAYIASVLRKNRYRVSVIDFNVGGFNPRLLSLALEDEKPAIIGISAHTETYCNAIKIAAQAKLILPDVKVVLGGTHSTVMYQEAAEEPSIDVVAIGEGEYTMLELADYFINHTGEIDQIKGIAYKQDGGISLTPGRPFIQNPDELPFPSRGLFPMPLYKTPGQVLSSRGGCPYNCHFCAVNNIWKGGRRFRSPENVIKEIESISANYELDEISFADDAFTMNRDHAMEICKLAGGLPFPWRWKCATRVDLIDEELLTRMHDSGCYSITYGIEAGSQEVLDAIGKNITLDQVRKSVEMTLKAGISVLCAFMFPHPYDNEDSIRSQTIFMKELKDKGVVSTMSFTTPFPGTYYYQHRDELGIKIETSDWSEFDCRHLLFTTPELPREKLVSLLAGMVAEVGMINEDEWAIG